MSMEKTVQIFIAATSFLCSEEAYERLSSYLARLKEHFRSEPEYEEIMRDIESRIAEKLLEQNHVLITNTDVATVIAEIGEVSEIDTDTNATAAPEKRLYRDPDTALIAGVASGIAAYFNVSALFIRLIFVLSLLFGGTGFIVYAILWLVVPEATTAAQKLEMNGKAVTFTAIGDMVRARGMQNEQHSALRRFTASLRSALTNVIQFSARVFGLIIMAGSFIGIICLSVLLGIILTNWNAPYNDIPFREASSPPLLGTAVASGYIVFLVPLLFIFAFGLRLLRTRFTIPAAVGFGLIGIWSFALVLAGVSGVKIAGDYYTYIETNPAYAIVTETHDLEPIERLIVNGVRVRIQAGDAYGVTMEGRAESVERVLLTSDSNVLTIGMEEPAESCLFCDHAQPMLTITLPQIAIIEITNGSVSFDDYVFEELSVAAENGSMYGSLEGEHLTIVAENGTVRSDIEVDRLALTGDRVSVMLSGTAQTADFSLTNAVLYADSLVVQNGTLTANDSYAELDVRGTLEQSTDKASEVHLEERSTGTE